MIYEYCCTDDECVPINFESTTEYHDESYLTWAGNDHAAHVGAYYDNLFDDIKF